MDRGVETTWRVSSGSAAVLGLRYIRMDAAPTTAYVMLGTRCVRDCAFCAQARNSQAPAQALSRVAWPTQPAAEVSEAIGRAHAAGDISRVCFQVTVGRGSLQAAIQAIDRTRRSSDAPICVSAAPADEEEVAQLLAAGAERVTIALDAACERVYCRVKGGSWRHTVDLLERCARRFPGHVGTHLIVGLGETQREMVERIQRCHDLGISVALFAFTPVRGTLLQGHAPPSLAEYRRIQVARWLIVELLARADDLAYDATGSLCDYGPIAGSLTAMLSSGDAFRTSGCPGCNRPYYNERPGGPIYNYPRALSVREAQQAVEDALAGTRR